MNVVEAIGIEKRFIIPSVARHTVREHALDFFRPRPVEELKVLDGISFALRRGETLGIMGRNGSGKSTLLRIIAGIYQPDRGRVERHAAITPILELGIGWNPELDAIDNVYLLGGVMGMTLAGIRDALPEILAFAELERFSRLSLKHYSSGMASRLAYAVAFRAVREVLVLDEIFAVGDAGFRTRCEARFSELKARGHSAILVSHDPRPIERFCERALLIEGGRIVAEGRGPEIALAYARHMVPPEHK